MINKFKRIFDKSLEFIINKKKLITSTLLILLVIISSIIIITNNSAPVLSLKSPTNEITYDYKDEIVIPVTLNKLPDNYYPAANMAVSFNKNKLEFVGIKIGTMEAYDDYDKSKDGQPNFKIPQWVYNADVANQEGVIKAMYLDTTASKNAYCLDGFKKKEKDTPLQLVFKLKDSVISNDKLALNIEEATFATISGDVDKSTISTKDNYGKLKIKNTEIKIK